MTTIAHKYQLIDRATLKSKLDKKEKFHLWNVLKKEYFKPEANIPGSKWLPVDALTEKVAQKNAGMDDVIVCYCGGGECKASLEAADKLAHMGYAKVFAYEGGLMDWRQAGMPLVKI